MIEKFDLFGNFNLFCYKLYGDTFTVYVNSLKKTIIKTHYEDQLLQVGVNLISESLLLRFQMEIAQEIHTAVFSYKYTAAVRAEVFKTRQSPR